MVYPTGKEYPKLAFPHSKQIERVPPCKYNLQNPGPLFRCARNI